MDLKKKLGRKFNITQVEEVQQLVSKLNKLRVVGTCHSFNRIADSDKNIFSLQN